MDWEAITAEWVEDGLITAEQRGPLLQRLDDVQPSVLPVASLMTVLVAPAVWLMVGSVIFLAVALTDPPSWVLTTIVSFAGAFTLGAGLLVRFAPSAKPLARGLLAASVPLTCIGMMSMLDEFNLEELVFGVVLAALAGWILGVFENSRAVTATATVSWLIATALMLMEYEWHGPIATLVNVGLGLAALAGLAVAHRQSHHRPVVFQIAAPAIVLLNLGVISLDQGYLRPWLQTVGIPWQWAWEKGLLMLAYGLIVMVLGLLSRSAFTLVPAVLCLSAATVWLSFELGSFIGGAIALSVVSLALFGLAVGLWGYPMVQAARARRESSSPEA